MDYLGSTYKVEEWDSKGRVPLETSGAFFFGGHTRELKQANVDVHDLKAVERWLKNEAMTKYVSDLRIQFQQFDFSMYQISGGEVYCDPRKLVVYIKPTAFTMMVDGEATKNRCHALHERDRMLAQIAEVKCATDGYLGDLQAMCLEYSQSTLKYGTKEGEDLI